MGLIAQPNTYVHTGNPIVYKLDDATGEATLSLKIGVNVLAQVTANWYGGYEFDISKYVKAFVSSTAPNVALEFNAQAESAITFTVDISIVGPAFTNNYTHSFTALRGGLPKEVFAQDSNFFAYMGFNGNQKLLTHQPLRKSSVSPENPEFLAFYTATWGGTITRNTTVYYTDGTSDIFTDAFAKSGDVITCIRCKLTDVPYDEQKEVLEYHVFFTDGTRTTRLQIFEVDHSFRRQERFFIFENSLGGWDTLRCFGEQESEANVMQEMASDYSGNYLANNILKTDMFVYDSSISNEHEVNTGYYPASYVAYLREFMLSKNKYLVISNKLYPVVLTSKKIKYANDEKNLKAASFSYSLAADSNEFYHPNMI
ncbi:hypothetical protein AD998_07660 [bacterium 336/3]|nr:hypothetical protein AD998_07660 [bacterium 336/3]